MYKVLRTLIFFFYTFSFSTIHAQQWMAYSSFSLSYCFFLVQHSTLWFGTGGGILHYDTDYHLLDPYKQNNGLYSTIISITHYVQRNIWDCYYDDESFNRYSKTLIFDGNLWITIS